jgi:hypothetical protein
MLVLTSPQSVVERVGFAEAQLAARVWDVISCIIETL